MINQNKPIQVGLAAYGLSGAVFHAPLISAHPGFCLKKVLSRSGNQQAKKKYPVEVVQDFRDILNDSEIELVVINTPEHTHYALGREALLAGKNVIVEKAFTTKVQEADDLIAISQDQGKILSVYQNSRWHGDFLTVQKIIEEKLLGKLVHYESHFDRFRNFIQPNSWKEEPHPGRGSLYNLGSHMIDQVLVLFGWPQALYADIRIERPNGKVDDSFELMLDYPDLKVTLKSSYLVREPGPRYILHGTDGSFIKYGTDPQEASLKAGDSPYQENYGVEPANKWGKLNTQLNGLHFEGTVETIQASYLGFYENIWEAIRYQKELLVKPEQARNTIKIIQAAIKSNEEGRKIFLE